MKRFHFIVNPAAGRGRGERLLPGLREKMAQSDCDCVLSVTAGPGEATKLAALAGREADVVVAVGGDGTINEIVNGLRESSAALGVLPIGSGNDFVKMVAIPADFDKAWDILFSGTESRIDLGRANDRLYVNSIGIGLDAAVARTMNRALWLRGKFAYYYGVLANIFFYRNKHIRWNADDSGGENRAVLAAVMNGTTYGGNFRVAPEARCDDGLLDLVIGGNYGVLGRLAVLPKFKRGRHLNFKKVTFIQARSVTIESSDPLPIQIDGEQLPESSVGTEVKIEVIPGGLRVISGIDSTGK